MKIKKILSTILGFVAAALLICAVWFSADYGWLKFGITSMIVASVAIFLAASEESVKRP